MPDIKREDVEKLIAEIEARRNRNDEQRYLRSEPTSRKFYYDGRVDEADLIFKRLTALLESKP